ncbi:hypothetical protein HpBT060_15200 [Helicobacter pylori]
MIGNYPSAENAINDFLLGYVLKNKVKAERKWFETPFKQVMLYNLLVDRYGFIDKNELKRLYLEFKELPKTQGKRYAHNKMGARRAKLVSYISNNKLKHLYLSWLKCKGLKWGDIDKALKDLMKLCAMASIETHGKGNDRFEATDEAININGAIVDYTDRFVPDDLKLESDYEWNKEDADKEDADEVYSFSIEAFNKSTLDNG